MDTVEKVATGVALLLVLTIVLGLMSHLVK